MRKFLKGKALFSAVTVVSMLALAACGGQSSAPAQDGKGTGQEQAAAGEPKDGGVLKIGLSSTAKTLDPIAYTGAYESNIIRSIGDTLVRYSGDLSKIEPSLATEWKVSDDMKVYTFKLRDNVYFQPGKYQDGRKMTAEDVKYSLERSSKQSALKRLRGVQSVEVISENEVALHLDQPNAALLAMLTDGGNIVVPREEVEGWGDQFGQHLIGTGPFQMDKFNQDDSVALKRADKYWGPKPHLDGVEFKFITDANMMTNALRSGDIDVVTDVKGQNRAVIEKDQNLNLQTKPGLSIEYMGLNQNEGPTKDKKVREAIRMAVDVEGLVKGVFKWGGAEKSYLPLPKASWGYDSALEASVPAFDPQKAKQLLAEAGYPDGFKTELYVIASRVPQATIAAQQLKDNLNIDVDIKTVEWGTFSDVVAKGRAPLYIMGWSWYPDPDFFLYQMFHSKQIGSLGNGYGYNNPEVDKLLDRATAETTDEAKRKEMYGQAMKMINDDVVHVELGLLDVATGMKKYVEDYQVRADSSIFLVNEETNVWLNK
ncbi:ABC transporter substrate-binding protein [Brevibacillus sp. SIMBA_040]|uniref:ABC transporter substrate-binding protein n=1 Tax=unclassified Brevibacillus TaxID=2684853 RepID=UPI00397C113C